MTYNLIAGQSHVHCQLVIGAQQILKQAEHGCGRNCYLTNLIPLTNLVQIKMLINEFDFYTKFSFISGVLENIIQIMPQNKTNVVDPLPPEIVQLRCFGAGIGFTSQAQTSHLRRKSEHFPHGKPGEERNFIRDRTSDLLVLPPLFTTGPLFK